MNLLPLPVNNMRRAVLILGMTAALGISCDKEGNDGYNSLVDIKELSKNEICQAGGVSVQTGLDLDRDNILDDSEVNETKFVCNGQSSASDKQIFLPINFPANTASEIPVKGGDLIKFSKLNYPGVDSIILVANPYVGDVANSSIVELYNLTDNLPVSNSTLSTSSLYETRTFLHTPNLYSQLPDKEIHLGISVKSGNQGMFAAAGSSFLILYRR